MKFEYCWDTTAGLPEGFFIVVELELDYEVDREGGVTIYGVKVLRTELYMRGVKSPLCVCFKHKLVLSAFEQHQREQAERDIQAYLSEQEQEAYIAHRMGC